MELTNLASTVSPQTEKKNNYNKANNSSAVPNSNNKITNFMITSQSPSPDRNNSMSNPKPNQVGVFMRKNVLINSDKKKDVSENSF